jgi:hypothetical protein
MITLLRRAGTGRLADGSRLIWTVAEGGRGRRWRWSHTTDAGLALVGLLELAPDGGFAKLELGSALGLLTLHPEGEAEAHGNVASSFGMRHLRFGWSDRHVVLAEGEPLIAAAACHRLAGAVGVGSSQDRSVLFVEAALTVRECTGRFTRESETRWRVELSPSPRFGLAIDDAGLPVGLQDEADWPLEVGAGS